MKGQRRGDEKETNGERYQLAKCAAKKHLHTCISVLGVVHNRGRVTPIPYDGPLHQTRKAWSLEFQKTMRFISGSKDGWLSPELLSSSLEDNLESQVVEARKSDNRSDTGAPTEDRQASTGDQ